jgi:serine/threonine-protein kinase RIM15
VAITDFELVKPLGKGKYARVCLARKKESGDYFAIKIIEKGQSVFPNSRIV